MGHGGGRSSVSWRVGSAEQRGVSQEKEWNSSPRRCQHERRPKGKRNPVLSEAYTNKRNEETDHVPRENGRGQVTGGTGHSGMV